MTDARNNVLIRVLLDGLSNEERRVERAQQEIFRIKMELLDLGVELPLRESEPMVVELRSRAAASSPGS